MANLAASWQDEWTDSWSAYGLPILPNFPIQSRQAYRTSAVETEAGYVQSFPLQSDGRRRWDLTWGPLSSTDKTTLMDFFDARTGSLQGFVWSHPIDGEAMVELVVEHGLAAVFHLPGLGGALGDDVDHQLGVEPRLEGEVETLRQPLDEAGDAQLVDHLGQLAGARRTH